MKGYRVIDSEFSHIIGKIVTGCNYFYPNAVDCLVSKGTKYVEVEAIGDTYAIRSKHGRKLRMNILMTNRLLIKRELTLNDFLEICTGVSEVFDEKGQLLQRSIYVGGQLHGLTEYWHPNGKMKLRVNYDKGQMSGLYEFWSKKGQLVRRYHYNKGKLDGTFEEWSKNGYLNEKRIYICCKLTQTWHYTFNGELYLMTCNIDEVPYQIRRSDSLDIRYHVRKHINNEWCLIFRHDVSMELIKLASDNNLNLEQS
jgi:hypothetical protein